MTVYLTAESVDDYLKEYIRRLEEAGMNDDDIDRRVIIHLKNTVVIKYTKKWQDNIYNELMHIWTEVPGGYWQLQELMHSPHVEFEHYRQKSRRSYEKGNVSLIMAKKELNKKDYLFYEHFKINNTTNGIKRVKNEETTYTSLDLEVEGKIKFPNDKKPKDL